MKVNRRWPVYLALILVGSVGPYASCQDFHLTIGKQEVLESKILGEKRTILVATPPRMPPGLPLLVVLDGEGNFTKVAIIVDHLVGNGRLPPMVVAGVVNTNRGRDLMPAFEGGAFAPGPSDKFLAFLADELIPRMAGEYPIGKYRILAGHSNAAMFSLYAFIRRPDAFQANIALSPSYGLDDRFVALLERALAKSGGAPRFVFVGWGGDEEPDIAVGALRFAKTFEGTPGANVEYHYEVFPGETHGSVGMRAFYRGLELLGQPDPPAAFGPARYLSEAQRRRHAWARRFGSSFDDSKLPLFSASLPMLDGISSGANLGALWNTLQADYADDFRFDPAEQANLVAALEARGRNEDAARLKTLKDFAAAGAAENNYGAGVDLKSGLIALLPLQGSADDLCHPGAPGVIHGALPAPDRHGKENRAWRFDGKGQYIEFPKNKDFNHAGSISVSAWVRPHTPAAYSSWVSQVGPRWGSQWRLGFGPNPAAQWGATIFGTRWTDYWINGDGLPLDQWVHTAAVFDQTLGELHIYLNGREVQMAYNLLPWGSSDGPILIGAQRDDGVYFNGDVSGVRVYRRALNRAEVEALSKMDEGSQAGGSCGGN